MLRNVSHTWVRELQQANAMLSFHSSLWIQSTQTTRPRPSELCFAGGDISESKFTWHSSMHTKGLLPAGDRPQLRRVSLTLENLNFTYIAAVQFMGGWHWHFTSLDAKNSTDMIKIVGLGSSFLSKSPGPTLQDNRFLAIFYYQGTRRWNIYLKHLAGEQGRYTQLVALCLQLLGDCCKGHQYWSCWAWGEMNQLLKS